MLINHIYHSKKATYNRAAELMDLVGLVRRYAGKLTPMNLMEEEDSVIGVARALVHLIQNLLVVMSLCLLLDVSIQASNFNLLMDLQANSESFLYVCYT